MTDLAPAVQSCARALSLVCWARAEARRHLDNGVIMPMDQHKDCNIYDIRGMLGLRGGARLAPVTGSIFFLAAALMSDAVLWRRRGDAVCASMVG